MDSMENKVKVSPVYLRSTYTLFLFVVVLLLSGWILMWQLFSGDTSAFVTLAAGIMFTLSVVLIFRLLFDADAVRATQTDSMLKLSRQIFASLQGGLNATSAQKICTLLLPSTEATTVAITDKASVLGCAGSYSQRHINGSPIFAKVLDEALQDGAPRLCLTAEEIGFYDDKTNHSQAIIIEPLLVGRKVQGALVFLYARSRKVSETQKSIAEGFAQLISTQIAAGLLEEQTKLATSMSLKALQSQINPHFLFNTINTIASLVRTDPTKARLLLREFAVFYRRTLADPSSLIPFIQEIEQVMRYFSFEVARFGEDRVCIEVEVAPECEEIMVPPFLIQPLVENAVQHAMPSEGKLTVTVEASLEEENLMLLVVSDDGIGMSQEACDNILHPESHTGIGIAVGNVHDRLFGFFGPRSSMDVSSELGKGTVITMHLDLEGVSDL